MNAVEPTAIGINGARATPLGTLTRLDLRALQQADRVSFHRHAGQDTIRCHKEVPRDQRGPFGDHEKTHDVGVTATVTIYKGGGLAEWPRQDADCFASMSASEYGTNVWHTVARMLRAGDVLALRWVGSNGNGYIDNARTFVRGPSSGEPLYHDNLYLVARRGKKTLTFYLDDSICPNNTARMVRPK